MLTKKLRVFLFSVMEIANRFREHGVTVPRRAPLLGDKGGILIVHLPEGIQLSVTIPSGLGKPILVCPIQDDNLMPSLEKKMRNVEETWEEIYRLRFVPPGNLSTSEDVDIVAPAPASAPELPFWKSFNRFNKPEDEPEFERRVLGLQAALIASDDYTLLTDSSPFR